MWRIRGVTKNDFSGERADRCRKVDGEKDINVTIGNENTDEPLKDCSIVTVNYSLDNKSHGKIGVIGPKRMDYAKVFASLDLISTHIDKILDIYRGDS